MNQEFGFEEPTFSVEIAIQMLQTQMNFWVLCGLRQKSVNSRCIEVHIGTLPLRTYLMNEQR